MSITEMNDSGNAEVLDRTKAPEPGKIKDIRFPDFYENKTENGITVLVIEDRKLPLVSTRFVYKTGSVNDRSFGENKSGLASLASELIAKGTKSRTATEIAAQIDFLGGALSNGCDYDASYVSTYSLKKHFDTMFDITTDIIINPTFPEEEIRRLKEQRVNTLLSYMDEVEYLASRVFSKNVYNKSPYGLPTEGDEESIKNLTKEDFINFHSKYYVPNNLIVAFVGDISPEEAMIKVNDKFGGIPMEEFTSNTPEEPEQDKKSRVYLIKKEGAVQSSIKLGHLGIDRGNPDFIKASILNTLLGGSFTSRINKNLREVNGYTYGAKSYFDWKKYSGDFFVDTEVKNSLTYNAVKEIIFELNEIRKELVSEEELQNIKNFITGNFPLQLETPNSIASKLINLKLYDIEDDYYNTYLSKVNKVTREEILETAKKYIHPDRLIISIAGNPDEVKEDMKQIAEVVVINKV